MKPSPRIPAIPCGADSNLIVDYFCWASDQARAEGLSSDHIEASVENPEMRSILIDIINGVTVDTLVGRYAAFATSSKGSVERLIYDGAMLIYEGDNSGLIRQKLSVR